MKTTESFTTKYYPILSLPLLKKQENEVSNREPEFP